MGGIGGREGIKWHQLTHNQLMSLQGPHFCAHSTAKTNDKVQISGRMASIGISDVVTASVYSEKTRLKKIARNDGFWRAPEIYFHVIQTMDVLTYLDTNQRVL